MPRLMRKTVRGHTYWYAVESKRVDGKPRITWQRYLGKMEDIIARCTQGPGAYDAVVYEFGAIAAVLSIAERLELEQIIDRHVPPGRQGVSTGRYLLLAAINRVVAPKSKVQIGPWYERTVLRRLWGLPAHHFTSQRFWQAMDRVEAAAIEAIEADLVRTAAAKFDVQLQGLIYDATNFFTYINTRNPASLPQRGHNKQKRNDLKQVSLALLAAADGHVPLLHETYAGHVPDSQAFAAVCDRLVARCRALIGQTADVTLVFDKGNNSRENLDRVARAGLHFVGSLVPSQHKDILSVPLTAYHEVNPERWPGLLAYRTVKSVFGVERVVVATFNPALWAGQMQGLRTQRARIEAALASLQARLARWAEPPPPRGRRPTPESTGRMVARLLRGREPGPFLQHEATIDDAGVVRLAYRWDESALQAMVDRSFGKTLLFSDQLHWSDEAIIAAYRSQAKIEDAFKQMKDPHFVCWRPLLHWTDQKIRVHAAYCVFALLLATLLQREVRRAGLSSCLDALLETLSGIKGVIDLPRGPSRRRTLPVSIRLTRREPEEERLFQILGLQRYHPEASPMTGTTT
ncbi:MAG: IS1634 family transposase [Clostridia bacterium]